jgi:phosphoribosylformylglycinamidine (FGAM) synthase PurS component
VEGLAVQDKAIAAFLHKRVKNVEVGKMIDVVMAMVSDAFQTV